MALIDEACLPPRDVVAETPFAATFAARRRAFLEHVRATPAPDHRSAVFHELARMGAGGEPDPKVVERALDHIDARLDCADFVMHGILRLLLQMPDDPRLPAELWARMRASVLDFKYWPDEPGADSMCTWTENHQILFAGAAFLAGGLIPERTFTNSGLSGRALRALHRPRILRWLDLRFRTGFSEWLSHVYYDEDMTALVGLADFADDPEVATRAAMVLDLLLLDLALGSFRGVFGTSHGRSYERTKKWAVREGTTDTAKLVLGTGAFARIESMAAPCLALAPRYRPPAVLERLSREAAGARFEVRQRMGIRVEEGARWGLGFESLEDGMVWLSMEAYTHPRTFPLFVRMLEAWDWWSNDFFRPFRLGRRWIRRLQRWRLLPSVARLLQRDLTRNLRPEVDVVTWRTPHAMLSSAPDWRPGYGGDQQHPWQATLGPDAVCFTTHPGPRRQRTPNHWTGSGSLPRVAQVGPVVVAIYSISRRPALYVPNRNGFTHAWLPRDRFDEVREQRGWFFARRGEGYLALRSQRRARWQEDPDAGEDRNRELVAPGWTNVWLCEVGDREEHGSFRVFCDRIAGAPLLFGDRRVRYRSPARGEIELAWTGPLRVEGRAVPQRGFPRYESPWVRAPFPAERIEVRCGGEDLLLDWPRAERRASAWLEP